MQRLTSPHLVDANLSPLVGPHSAEVAVQSPNAAPPSDALGQAGFTSDSYPASFLRGRDNGEDDFFMRDAGPFSSSFVPMNAAPQRWGAAAPYPPPGQIIYSTPMIGHDRMFNTLPFQNPVAFSANHTLRSINEMLDSTDSKQDGGGTANYSRRHHDHQIPRAQKSQPTVPPSIGTAPPQALSYAASQITIDIRGYEMMIQYLQFMIANAKTFRQEIHYQSRHHSMPPFGGHDFPGPWN